MQQVNNQDDYAVFNIVVNVKNGRKLSNVLIPFENNSISINHVETRKSTINGNVSELFVQLQCSRRTFNNISKSIESDIGEFQLLGETKTQENVPWFPRHISELEKCGGLVKKYNPDLFDEHPGFFDDDYKERRKFVEHTSLSYEFGQPIPRIDYTDEENATWTRVYKKVKGRLHTYACNEYIEGFKKLEEAGIFREDKLPQMEDISQFLKRQTGFQLRPVAGWVSARDFIASLAFRTFMCTQYVRHKSYPDFSPDPDVIHELIGHIPMFTNPEYARFLQELGLASMGATDDDLTRLSKLFWFTVEVGICRQNGEIRAYGAAIMSSNDELAYLFSGKPEIKEFSAETAVLTEYKENVVQEVYLIVENQQSMMNQLRKFVHTMERPFVVRYDPYTQSVYDLDKTSALSDLSSSLQEHVDTLRHLDSAQV